MNEDKKKKTKDAKKEDGERLEKEDIPSEDVDMIREKNDPNASLAYQDDNSWDDEK